jgi:hypothetical protein
MEFFHLQHPLNATVLCDRKGCEQVDDYLEVDDHGHEYRVCAVHTRTARRILRGCRRGNQVPIFLSEADLLLGTWGAPPVRPASCRRRWEEHTNESAPDSSSHGTPVEQLSPENCSPLPYVTICAVGMAPMGYCGNVRQHLQDTSDLVLYGHGV